MNHHRFLRHVQKRLSLTSIASALAAVLAMLAPPASAIDVDAGDYTAAPAGTTVGLIYYQHAERNDLYAGGNMIASNGRMSSDIGILRVIQFMKLGDYVIDPQVLIPFGKLNSSGNFSSLGSDSGIGDVIFAATLWTVNRPETKTYLGFTPFLYAPTGSYNNNRSLNIGENRWRYAMQVGFIQGLGDKFTMDALADVMIYGKNNDFGPNGATLKQAPSYQLQLWGRYHVTPQLDVRLGVSQAWLGESKVNGVAANDQSRVTKASLGFGYQLTQHVQLLGLYGRDLKITNGLKEENRLNLRVAYAF